ncbi:hypothetical protein NN561_009123 [Cricetulus griseus]
MILHEPHAEKKNIVHFPRIADPRGEEVANGQKKAATAASPKDEEDDDAATAASPKDEEDDDAAAAATSNNGIRHEFIIQSHFGKAGNHQFPVTTKKHVGLNEKICDEKNKAVEHLDAIDDHQLSQSASEDDILPDYDNILMIVDQLQMNYKDSGRLLEIQDAVHSYKMILEHKQSHSELLTEKSKKMKIGASEMLKKPRETEKAKSQLRCKNEEQQLELIGVGLAGKQEEQQRNAHYLHEEIKKQLTEKEEQHKKEKQQLEMCLKAQDTELRHLRNHMKKLQEARDQETQAEESDRMMKEHLQKTEDQLKEVTTQFRMVTQHNMSLLNVLASECPCVANFHKCLGNLFTQENMVTPNMLTPTSRPQSSKQYRTANLDVEREENQQTFDDRRGNHKASYMRPQEPKITNLKPKHPEELAHQTSHKAEPNQYEELYLEMIEMTKSLSHEQLKSKDRQDEAMRKNFEKTELYRSAPNTYMTSPVQGVAAGHPHSSQEHGGNFIQGEPFVTGSSPWHFVESLDNYLCRVSYAIHFDYGFRHLL